MLIHLNSCQQLGHMHDYICLKPTGWSVSVAVPAVDPHMRTRKCIWWIHFLRYHATCPVAVQPFSLLSNSSVPSAFLENNLNWFQSKTAFLFSGFFNFFLFCVFSFFLSGTWRGNGLETALFFALGKGFWEKGTHAFSVKIVFKRNKIWLYNNASLCACDVCPPACMSVCSV